MNTTEKGNKLEHKALEIINTLIEEKQLGILKECIRVFKKKKYPSKLKGCDPIEFDLTIEVWAPSAPNYSMIYIFECKNYETRVPKEKIKKFHSDIVETHGANAKGIIITNSPLQKGAIQKAEAEGIMVIEGESKDNFKITLWKRLSLQASKIPFVNGVKSQDTIDQGIISLEKIVDKQILSALTTSQSQVSYGIDKLSKKHIESITLEILDRINKNLISQARGLDKNTIIDFLLSEFGVKVSYYNPNKEPYLGVCDIEGKEIGISKSIVDTNREMFVLCHEFGHYILHQKLRINQTLLDSFSDTQPNFMLGKRKLENPRHWIEWQANYFSASILLPETSIKARLWKSMKTRGMGMGKFILTDDPHRQRTFVRVTEYLSAHFNVSKTTIIYRLQELDLVVKKSNIKTIGELIEEFISGHFS